MVTSYVRSPHRRKVLLQYNIHMHGCASRHNRENPQTTFYNTSVEYIYNLQNTSVEHICRTRVSRQSPRTKSPGPIVWHADPTRAAGSWKRRPPRRWAVGTQSERKRGLSSLVVVPPVSAQVKLRTSPDQVGTYAMADPRGPSPDILAMVDTQRAVAHRPALVVSQCGGWVRGKPSHEQCTDRVIEGPVL